MRNATLFIENKRKILLAGTMSTTILMDGAFRLRKISKNTSKSFIGKANES